MILCICTVKVELVQYSEQISLLASCRFTNFCHRLWKDANGTHLMIQQILKCLQVTRSVSASTLRSWPLRHDLNVQFVLAYPPESRPGWLLWRHLDLLKREMQVVWSNRYLGFFWIPASFDTKWWKSSFFWNTNIPCFIFRWSGESAFFEIRQLGKDIWYNHDICMRAKQTSAQHQVPKPDLSKME